MANLETRFWQKVTKTDSCWLWTAATSDAGYGVIGRGGRGNGNVRASHVSIFLKTGEWPPKGMYVCHHCDTPACVNPEHLYVGTPSENMRDCKKRGRHKTQWTKDVVGSAHNRSKIVEADAIAMRALYATDRFSLRQIGELFDVDWSCVRSVVQRKTWRHV